MNTSELAPSQLTTTLEMVIEIIAEMLDDDTLVLTGDTARADVAEWDSLAHVGIVFALEDEFGLRLSDDILGDFATVGDLAAKVHDAQRRT
jgi:acyl carrier protein